MARFDLTDAEWAAIEPVLPTDVRGKERADDRRVLNGIFWRLRTGAPWAEIAEHVVGRPTVMRLAFGDLERDGPALGIHQRVDLARQAAARATHATGSVVFFLAQPAC